ncbi:hypothetical protein CTI12_AA229420 [Artemisia annua]|uniref:DUF4216 domain-containing protein n=1 Tax=Artemisia annua TaxID=35608 RepID=A0A2U1NTJ4_ARTAN|nr:hypothetical protein CTI12_AA229420 [Artemisia annua]
MQKVVWYVLHNSDEIDPYMNEYKRAFPGNDIQEGFAHWFGNKNDPSCTTELFALACGPSCTAVSVNSCIVNGVKFIVHDRDLRRSTQNSGISTPNPCGGMFYGQLEEILELLYIPFNFIVHDRDLRRSTQNSGISTPNPCGGMFYGQLEEILELLYIPFNVVLFKVKWFDTNNDGRIKRCTHRNNITQIMADRVAFENEPYILSTQATQVFYLDFPGKRGNFKVVQDSYHRKIWNPDIIVVEDNQDVVHDSTSSYLTEPTDDLDGRDLIALYRHNHTRNDVWESVVSEARYVKSTSEGHTMSDLDIIRHVIGGKQRGHVPGVGPVLPRSARQTTLSVERARDQASTSSLQETNQMIQMRTESTSEGHTMSDLDIIRHVIGGKQPGHVPGVGPVLPRSARQTTLSVERARDQASTSSLQETVQKQSQDIARQSTLLDGILAWARSQPGFPEQLATLATQAGTSGVAGTSQEASQGESAVMDEFMDI